MSESIAGEARWDDVDKGTFLRFVQFAYTGDYSVPQSMADQSIEREEVAASAVDDWNRYDRFPSTKKKQRKGTSFGAPPSAPEPIFSLDAFGSLDYPSPTGQSSILNASAPIISDDYTMLLAHAMLYVLADKWGVDNLKQLALSKLHQALYIFRLDASNVQDFVDLTRYIYSGTFHLEHGIDKLREMICYYIATYSSITSEHATFAAMLKEEGDLASDLWRIVGSRICIAE